MIIPLFNLILMLLLLSIQCMMPINWKVILHNHTLHLKLEMYAILSIGSKDIASTSTVPVVFKPGVNGTYTLSFDDITTFDPTVYIFFRR